MALGFNRLSWAFNHNHASGLTKVHQRAGSLAVVSSFRALTPGASIPAKRIWQNIFRFKPKTLVGRFCYSISMCWAVFEKLEWLGRIHRFCQKYFVQSIHEARASRGFCHVRQVRNIHLNEAFFVPYLHFDGHPTYSLTGFHPVTSSPEFVPAIFEQNFFALSSSFCRLTANQKKESHMPILKWITSNYLFMNGKWQKRSNSAS